MNWLYLGVLVACVVATLPLEVFLHTRVYARPHRLLLTLVPVFAVFVTWDALAVHARQWSYRHLLGVVVGNLPIEELAFFVVIPICAILTLEAVRARRPAWTVGDE